MGKPGLRQTLVMLAAAFCGVGASAAYVGLRPGGGVSAPTFERVLRFAMPDAIAPAPAADSLQTEAPDAAQNPSGLAATAETEAAATATGANQEAAASGAASPAAAAKTAESAYTPSAPAKQAASTQGRSLTGLGYNLSGGADSANAIQTQKSIQVPGSSPFTIGVRIDENSAIYVDARQLSSLIPPEYVPSTANGYVSLEQLRSKGVAVRYNAALDRIELQPGGA